MSNYITIDSCIITSSEIIIPNVFSPNGDGFNDLFNASGTNIISLSLSIYNRWGTLLFQTNNKNTGWNGRTTAGTECSDGTYFYLFEIDGELYKGTLTLLRGSE